MIFDTGFLVAAGIAYLGLLFLTAHASEKGWLPVRLVRHPLVYTLALGVFATTWALFGAVEFAGDYGYIYLTFFLGFSGAFLLAPVVLQPLLRLARAHQLQSLADMMAFRYRSQWVGTLITLILLLGMLPILTMQIQSVTTLARYLTGTDYHTLTSLFFCTLLGVFTLLFGARTQYARQQRHDGLLVALALESLIKLVALLAIAAYAYLEILGGAPGLRLWLEQHPQALAGLFEPLQSNYWHSLLLMFFFASVVMPAIYHLALTEHRQRQDLLFSSWALPLYLFVMALCIPIILWGGDALGLPIAREFHALSIALHADSAALSLLLFIGAIAAGSGILIVSTLALANMLVNHLALPLRRVQADDGLYQQTLNLRRAFILLIPLLAFLLAYLPQLSPDSTEMSMLGFVLMLQAAPAVIAMMFWPRATSVGVIAGLFGGLLVWFAGLLLPSFAIWELRNDLWLQDLKLDRLGHWQAMGVLASLVNISLLLVVSMCTRQSAADRELAHACSVDQLRSPMRWHLNARSVDDFTTALKPVLGPVTAEREVQMALTDLGIKADETRPYALRRLRDQLNANLSGLLGPSVARDILDSQIPQLNQASGRSDDIHFIESRLEEYRDRLSGLAAELDLLRRFHRQTLHDLPLGVCTLGQDLEILSWNQAMTQLTGCSDGEVVGSQLTSLPPPWNTLLQAFLDDPSVQWRRRPVMLNGEARWINLHRALIGEADGTQVLVMEDVTTMQQLQARLHHNERLAGIGRLAAGVAHEIGNPVTGIASLAQNLRADLPTQAVVQETTGHMLEQTRRITRIVQALVGFSRADQPVGDILDSAPLLAVVQQAVELIRLTPHARHIRFDLDIDDALCVMADSQRLCQVFVNLLSNACDASPETGQIVVRARLHGPIVQIEVEDFGHGLPGGQTRETLFEPFVTTKPAGMGTGLGLALVHGIIESHGGSIQLIDKADYDQGQGVIAQIKLPSAQEEPLP